MAPLLSTTVALNRMAGPARHGTAHWKAGEPAFPSQVPQGLSCEEDMPVWAIIVFMTAALAPCADNAITKSAAKKTPSRVRGQIRIAFI